MVLPSGGILIEDLEVNNDSTLPSKTYRLDFENGRCVGMIDGLEAIKQSIFKMLSTERFKYLIYSDNYGFENLIGKERLFVQAELLRRIEEAVLQDTRVLSVEDMNIQFQGDSAIASFVCQTVYGKIEMSKEVNGIV
ncbi:DUF2634 domain-containing protein [Anoxybacteroides amylolyticum]|uniref:DUF2634 domain-containing protein n=1 Tax=Anoxybacteroides amylolyticum TaxID=294699 RepID=A0A160F734_9BACL|nr:DUF2634 domain-containing protein [Anoxybacillus amylolyticus]ANB62111.1 hypothetical protein GFC30_3157 [Anoxybacillus amylolyticus]